MPQFGGIHVALALGSHYSWVSRRVIPTVWGMLCFKALWTLKHPKSLPPETLL